MLKRLSIKNVALIERLDMDFDNGLNVLTGETGAGKSIIIDAVNLALGERASRELITTGAEKASVEAEFDIEGEEAVKSMLRQNELEDDGLIISRELSASGKNVCRINGTLVNLATLKQITDLLVDVHGQHEHQSLLMQSRHIRFLILSQGKGIGLNAKKWRGFIPNARLYSQSFWAASAPRTSGPGKRTY